jgi:ribonuclease D
MLFTDLPEPAWIDQPGPLADMVQELAHHPILAVDTESNSLHAYQEQVCLIQFSTTQIDYLLDPLALQKNLAILGGLFANPAIEKIFHAAEYDVLCLKRDFSFTFTNLFDTMVAGRILGRPAVGLASMLEAEFGIALDKHFQRANWGQRPLSTPMKAYARLDTHYLFPLRDRLKEELQKMGRWALAEEDFVRLCALSGHNGHSEDVNLAAFWRISGVLDLNPHQLAVMKELYIYRDQQARLSNQPHFKILSNQVLLEVAQTCPHYMQELHLLPTISDLQIRRYGKALLEAVKRGTQAPPLKRPTMQRTDEQVTNRLEILRSWRKRAGLQMGVESDVILPRDVLSTIAAANPGTPADLAGLMTEVPWRFEHFGKEILRTLGH